MTENEIANKAKNEALWELIQDLISNVVNLRAENAVLKKQVEDGKTTSA